MHFLKEGQKIQAWVDPPPLIQAMPERKHFFLREVFPKSLSTGVVQDQISNILYSDNQHVNYLAATA